MNKKTKSTDNKKEIVVVLGAGRTGTSLLMQILEKLGLNVSEEMTPPSEQNLQGGYEDSQVYDIHTKILQTLGVNQMFPLPEGWIDDPCIEKIQKELLGIIKNQVNKASTIWGVKDPRFTMFLPMWHSIFNRAKVIPHYILAVREPASVVRSMKMQYNTRESLAELYWMQQNCDALHNTGGNCFIVHYEEWFDKSTEIAEELANYTGLVKHLPGNITDVLTDIIRPEQNRAVYNDYVIQNDNVIRLYDVLKECRNADFDRVQLMKLVSSCRAMARNYKGWYLETQSLLKKRKDIVNRKTNQIERERKIVSSYKLKFEAECTRTSELKAALEKEKVDYKKLPLMQPEQEKLKLEQSQNDISIFRSKLERERKKNEKLKVKLELEKNSMLAVKSSLRKARIESDTFKSKLQKEREFLRNIKSRLEKESNKSKSITRSLSYRFGNKVVLAFAHPGWNTIRLPYDILRLFAGTFFRKVVSRGKTPTPVKQGGDNEDNEKPSFNKKTNSKKAEQPKRYMSPELMGVYADNKRLLEEMDSVNKEVEILESELQGKAKISEQLRSQLEAELNEKVLLANKLLQEIKSKEDEILEQRIKDNTKV
jgi:hypothetical protein